METITKMPRAFENAAIRDDDAKTTRTCCIKISKKIKIYAAVLKKCIKCNRLQSVPNPPQMYIEDAQTNDFIKGVSLKSGQSDRCLTSSSSLLSSSSS